MPVFTSTSISLAKTCCPFSLMCGAHLIVFSSITSALVSDVRDRSAAMQKMAFWTLPLELTSRWKLVFASTSISIAQTCCPFPPGVLCAFARILTDPNRSDQRCARSFRSDAKDGILELVAQEQATKRSQHSGRAICIDLLSFVESAQVCRRVAQAGLQAKSIFSYTQATPWQCGHNCARHSVLLRALGNSFDDLSPEDANAVNTQALAGSQAAWLSINAGLWLSGDQILNLIELDNPDGPGTRADGISGPAPLNYFYTFFAQTLASPAHHGRVHITVVNTCPHHGGQHLP